MYLILVPKVWDLESKIAMFFGHTKYLKIWNEYPTQILDSSRLGEVKIRQTKKIKLHVKNVNV